MEADSAPVAEAKPNQAQPAWRTVARAYGRAMVMGGAGLMLASLPLMFAMGATGCVPLFPILGIFCAGGGLGSMVLGGVLMNGSRRDYGHDDAGSAPLSRR